MFKTRELISPSRLTRRLFRTFMSLPPPVLRLLAGGAGVHHNGRTLDARLQYLGGLAPNKAAAGLGLPDHDGAVIRERLAVESQAGPVAVTALRPPRQDPDLPVLVFLALGGGLASNAAACESLCAAIARSARAVVVCLDQSAEAEPRLADAHAALRAVYDWARANGPSLGAPAGDAAIGGAALGAALAARITHDLRASGEPQPALLLLVSPNLDPTATDGLLEGGLDLAGLAPAVIATTGFDAACATAEAYARRLRAAGVSCHFRCYDSLTEGFIAFTGVAPAAARAAREIVTLAAHALQSRYVPAGTEAMILLRNDDELAARVDRTQAFH